MTKNQFIPSRPELNQEPAQELKVASKYIPSVHIIFDGEFDEDGDMGIELSSDNATEFGGIIFLHRDELEKVYTHIGGLLQKNKSVEKV